MHSDRLSLAITASFAFEGKVAYGTKSGGRNYLFLAQDQKTCNKQLRRAGTSSCLSSVAQRTVEVHTYLLLLLSNNTQHFPGFFQPEAVAFLAAVIDIERYTNGLFGQGETT